MKWDIGQVVGKQGGGETKEKKGKEDVVQTFVNYILQNWYTYFIFSDRVRGGGDNSMWMYATTDMLGCSDMHEPAWRDLGATRDLWQHQDVEGGNWDIKRNMEHILPQAFTFTNPLSAHSHNICPALFILKSIHIS